MHRYNGCIVTPLYEMIWNQFINAVHVHECKSKVFKPSFITSLKDYPSLHRLMLSSTERRQVQQVVVFATEERACVWLVCLAVQQTEPAAQSDLEGRLCELLGSCQKVMSHSGTSPDVARRARDKLQGFQRGSQDERGGAHQRARSAEGEHSTSE